MRVDFGSRTKQKEFFRKAKESRTWKQLHELIVGKLDSPPTFRTFQNWYKGNRLPEIEVVQMICGLAQQQFDQLDVELKNDNWGRRKGGETGILKLRKKYSPAIIAEWRRRGGENCWNLYRKKHMGSETTERIERKAADTRGKNNFRELMITAQTKQEIFSDVGESTANLEHAAKLPRWWKRWNKILKKNRENMSYFRNNLPFLIMESIHWSRYDLKKGIKFPRMMDELLAEEIGVHIGDGTLTTRNRFSVRLNSNEIDYANYLAELYYRLYNYKPKIFVRGSVCGFEIYSEAIFRFKISLGLPFGKKSNIDIPDVLRESQNMKLIAACIRGIFDTDGCVYFMDNFKHSKILIASQSVKLIDSLTFFLDKMGFEPRVYDNGEKINGKRVVLYGLPMLKLWMEKIGTRNPKHYIKFRRVINGPVVQPG